LLPPGRAPPAAVPRALKRSEAASWRGGGGCAVLKLRRAGAVIGWWSFEGREERSWEDGLCRYV